MAVEMRTSELEDEEEYIDTARGSEQFEVLLAMVENEVVELEEQRSSAVSLYDVAADESGVRVDFLYDVVRESEPAEVSLNVQLFYPETGGPEAVGYMRDDTVLLKEIYTNEEIVPDYRVDEPDGTVILETRGYDEEDLLE